MHSARIIIALVNPHIQYIGTPRSKAESSDVVDPIWKFNYKRDPHKELDTNYESSIETAGERNEVRAHDYNKKRIQICDSYMKKMSKSCILLRVRIWNWAENRVIKLLSNELVGDRARETRPCDIYALP